MAWISLVTVATAGTPWLDHNHHVWARFKPGAWRDVEVVTTTYEESKQLRSTTTSLIFLESVFADSYRLQMDVSMSIANKRFSTPTQFVSQTLYAETVGKCEAMEELPFEEDEQIDPGIPQEDPRVLEVAGKMIPVKRYRLVVQGDSSREVTKVFYSPDCAPYVLRKQTILWNAAGDQRIYSEVHQLQDVKQRRTVLGRPMSTWTVVTTRNGNKGTMRTETRYAREVPGGILSQTSQEWDAGENLIRTSELRLVDYGLRAERSRRFRRGFIRPLDRFRRRKLGGPPAAATEPVQFSDWRPRETALKAPVWAFAG